MIGAYVESFSTSFSPAQHLGVAVGDILWSIGNDTKSTRLMSLESLSEIIRAEKRPLSIAFFRPSPMGALDNGDIRNLDSRRIAFHYFEKTLIKCLSLETLLNCPTCRILFYIFATRQPIGYVIFLFP